MDGAQERRNVEIENNIWGQRDNKIQYDKQ